jgi:ribonucleoside-diphosphate reductase alpha chain
MKDDKERFGTGHSGTQAEHEMDSLEVRELKEQGIELSEQALDVLNNSQSLNELGRAIFLDRYSVKAPRTDIEVGDLVIAVTEFDRKYPKKELAIVTDIVSKTRLALHLVTGGMKGEAIEQEWNVVDKPIESIQAAYRRVAKAVASVETTPRAQSEALEEFSYQLERNHIQPAGRIMTGANVDESGTYTSNLTLYNCYVIPSPKDSRQGIIRETLQQMVEVMSRGGGVGINLSSLRPRYAYVRGVHGKSSGAVSWGGLYSFTTGLIEQGGSRRGALMLMLGDWHPDVLEFIESKTKTGQIENANISVLISDAFMKAVKEDNEWKLVYPDYEHAAMDAVYEKEWDGNLRAWKEKGYPVKTYRTIRARELWDKLLESAWASAEPGMVFIDRYNDESNSWYFNPIVCTNPCGEQGLPAWGVCNLGHLNLASFCTEVGEDETGPIYDIDWDALKRSSRALTRFLDNVIDLTPYHFPENEKNQKSERRIGAGTLGLGEMLIKMRLRYGSDEALEFTDKVYRTIATEAYLASADLAKQRGSFPKFDAEKFLESGFMKRMPQNVREAIRSKGMRNVTVTTQAPTGTVGSMLGTSTGIEPYFAFEYYRQSRLGFYKVLIPLAQQYQQEDGSLPGFFVGSMDLSPEEHIKMQAAIQRWTDSSISKTANVPNSFTVEDTKVLYEQAYDLGCKGVTIYRDGSRSEQILSTDANTEKKNKGETAKSEEKPVEEKSVEAVEELEAKLERTSAPYKREVGTHAVQSQYYEVATGYGNLHVNIVYDEIGPVKIFANISPLGTEISGLTSAVSILVSKFLEQGGDPKKLLKHLNSIKGDKPFGFGPNRVDSIPHAISKVLRDHLIRTGKLQDYSRQATLALQKSEVKEPKNAKPSLSENAHTHLDAEQKQQGDLFCPQCYSRNVGMVAGCKDPTCFDCGYSKCG